MTEAKKQKVAKEKDAISYTFRIPKNIFGIIKGLAATEKRSLNAQWVYMMETLLKEKKLL